MHEKLIELFDEWTAGFGVVLALALRIVVILIIAWAALRLVRRLSQLVRAGISHRIDDIEAAKRAETLGRVIRYVANVVIYSLTVMLILTEVGISVAPILGAAGVVGLAVGFGAQSLVKDFVTGFFLLLENQIRQGDEVKLGAFSGTVENLTLRYVQLRDYDGHVHFVPNGTITTVTNMSRGFGQAVIEMDFALGQPVDSVIETMREVGEAVAADPAFASSILGPLEITGVERMGTASMTLRGRLRTRPGAAGAVRREYLRRLRQTLDERAAALPPA